MQSNGGLAEAARFQGKDAILSGPAGGIVGAARTAGMAGLRPHHRLRHGRHLAPMSRSMPASSSAPSRPQVAGVRMRAPMMAINTVAAGGGSILHFDGARFRVGPESAGAVPGPACYRRGGPLTVTDANVMVGKIQPRHFPAIFGPDGDQPLDADVVREKFAALAAGDRGRHRHAAHDPRAVAEGFLRVAVANMANAIKQVSIQKGHDATRYALQCFGGAGGQHACLVADALGMETVFIHPFAGVLSRLWHGPRRPDRDPRGGGGAPLTPKRHGRPRRDGSTRWRRTGRAELAAPGRRRRRASPPRAACICATPAPTASCPSPSATMPRCSRPSPTRIAAASASPRRSAR